MTVNGTRKADPAGWNVVTNTGRIIKKCSNSAEAFRIKRELQNDVNYLHNEMTRLSGIEIAPQYFQAVRA